VFRKVRASTHNIPSRDALYCSRWSGTSSSADPIPFGDAEVLSNDASMFVKTAGTLASPAVTDAVGPFYALGRGMEQELPEVPA